jgi:hypothetical protein
MNVFMSTPLSWQLAFRAIQYHLPVIVKITLKPTTQFLPQQVLVVFVVVFVCSFHNNRRVGIGASSRCPGIVVVVVVVLVRVVVYDG